MKICSICHIEKENHCFIRGNATPVCKSCKDKRRREYAKRYRQDNKDKILLKNKLYKKRRRSDDPSFRLANNCSRMINLALNGNKNNYSIWDFLPYTVSELKSHLEFQFDECMSWDNYGSYWHLDHITPQSSFFYTSMKDDDFLKCWSLTNLRPLEAIENIKKSNRLIYEIE
jgi:hypothetical protein